MNKCTWSVILEAVLAIIGLLMGFVPMAYIDKLPLTGFSLEKANFYLYYSELFHSYYIILFSASFIILIMITLQKKKNVPMDAYILINSIYAIPVTFITLGLAQLPTGALTISEVLGDGTLTLNLNISKTLLGKFILFDGLPIFLIFVVVVTIYNITCKVIDERLADLD